MAAIIWLLLLTATAAAWITHTEKSQMLLPTFAIAGLAGLAFIGLLYRRSRQRLDERLQAARDEWEHTFDAIEDIVTIFDRDMRVVRANRASRRLSGMDPEAIRGKFCYELFRGAAAPCPDCPVAAERSQAKSVSTTMQHGEKIFAISCAPLITKKGEITGFVHIAKEITEQRQLENRLRQAQRLEAIGTLAGGIAHDFNNILTPITGFTEMAASKLPADSPAVADLREVTRAAGRARELVRQILAFGRKSEGAPRPLKPEPIIKEALKLMRSTLPSTIEIRQEIAPECGLVLADSGQLYQVIMNLCTNAYHAMRDSGGVLAVRLDKIVLTADDARLLAEPDMKPGPYLRLEVSDSGRGMEKEAVERIFEPYYTTKTISEGGGLGMAVVHGTIRQYGGRVSVYSEPGQGTTILVYLPLLEDGAIKKEPECVPDESLPQGRENVLVVDDDKIIAGMLRHMLIHLGYQVTAFDDPREVLALIKEKPAEFNLLITDMTMPHLTGAELAIEAMAAAPGLRVILFTGFSELINQEKSRQMGIHAFLMKPVTLQQLARTVDQVLHAKEGGGESGEAEG